MANAGKDLNPTFSFKQKRANELILASPKIVAFVRFIWQKVCLCSHIAPSVGQNSCDYVAMELPKKPKKCNIWFKVSSTFCYNLKVLLIQLSIEKNSPVKNKVKQKVTSSKFLQKNPLES